MHRRAGFSVAAAIRPAGPGHLTDPFPDQWFSALIATKGETDRDKHLSWLLVTGGNAGASSIMVFEPHIPKSVRREIGRAVDAALASAQGNPSSRPHDDAHLRTIAEMFNVEPDEMVAYIAARRRYFSFS